ncbi:prolyl oligopeptidase family protein [Mycolicibacterium cosmeticum]|uniref:Prolyl oligopeptidase family protein n=2 Tax=Mycolicibacterium cosmeticum TaxID=258533 RepID=W9AZP9_MYCCO|nr:prolyl oligopeptidase family protein [Mycolicibacterium cosmeticum]
MVSSSDRVETQCSCLWPVLADSVLTMRPTLHGALQPFTRTGGYYARSWRDYLYGGSKDLPIARPTLALAAEALRDEVALIGLRARRPLGNEHEFERIHDEVVAALEFYGDRGCLTDPTSFFAAPGPLGDVEVTPVRRGSRFYARMRWDSGFVPAPGEPGGSRWTTYRANARGYGLLLRHREPRPWLVCVHGTEMGRAAIDLALFRAWYLHDSLGLNVVLPVLPMHGPRANGLPKGAVFPGADILDDIHATAQAVWDIRGLLDWIRRQQPGAAIGLYGLSLGGFIAALVASLDRYLTCAVLGVPVADLIDLLSRHAGLDRNDPRRRTILLATTLGRMISPLALSPRVPPTGRFIYAGLADQVVHPREQVTRLWEHWGRPQIEWYRGGHTGFFHSRPVNRFVVDALVRSGLVAQGIGSPGPAELAG